jgi:hypothetical protein
MGPSGQVAKDERLMNTRSLDILFYSGPCGYTYLHSILNPVNTYRFPNTIQSITCASQRMENLCRPCHPQSGLSLETRGSYRSSNSY